jgi:hypothetical protein
MAEETGQQAKKTRKKSKIVARQPKTIDEWLSAKVKFPNSYGVSPEGMLIAPPSKPGDIEKTFVLEPRLPAPTDHIIGEFEKRSAEIKTAEEQFTEARRTLQRTIVAYRQGLVTAAEVVIANQQVKEAEAFVIEKAVSPRSIVVVEPTPEIRQVLLDDQYAVNKFADPVYCLKRGTFPWTNFYSIPNFEAPVKDEVQEQEQVKAVLEQDAAVAEAAAAAAKADNARRGAIIAAKTAKRKITFA